MNKQYKMQRNSNTGFYRIIEWEEPKNQYVTIEEKVVEWEGQRAWDSRVKTATILRSLRDKEEEARRSREATWEDVSE